MTRPPIRMVGLLSATVARMAVGALFYSPVGFVRAWSRLSGVSDAKMAEGMGTWITVDVVGSVLMACVLAATIFYSGAKTMPRGMAVAFMNWFGFVAVALIQRVTYEKSPFALFAINAGFQLVSMLAMGAILSRWGLRWAELRQDR